MSYIDRENAGVSMYKWSEKSSWSDI